MVRSVLRNFSSKLNSAVDHKSSVGGPLHVVSAGEDLSLVIAILFPGVMRCELKSGALGRIWAMVSHGTVVGRVSVLPYSGWEKKTCF
jgi:hypothetical protein